MARMVHELMQRDRHEQVSFCFDADSGLRAIVAIHDTTLGPALGGTRLLPYESESRALADVLRLSTAMSYKAAAAGLDLGGGKAVIIGDPGAKDRELFEAFGRAIDRLGGSYITTEDMNTTVADMDVVAGETEFVVGTSEGLGDPSPVTAHGIVAGMRACMRERTGESTVADADVLVQGVGKVGMPLAEQLLELGANVTLSDPNESSYCRLFDRIGNELPVIPPTEVYTHSCDVFAPCALGRLGLGDEGSLRAVIDELRCDIVAGAANNALGDPGDDEAHAEHLAERDILYAPDYVINAGGLISTYHDWNGNEKDRAYADAERIEERLGDIFTSARTDGITTLEAADRYAEQRLGIN